MPVNQDKTKRHTRQQRRKKSNRKKRKRKELKQQELKRQLKECKRQLNELQRQLNESTKREGFYLVQALEYEAMNKKRQVLYEHYGVMHLGMTLDKVYTNLSYTSWFPDSLRYDPITSVIERVHECIM